MRILALDHGTVRVGVAVSDPLKMIAQPLEFIPVEPFPECLSRIKELVRTNEVELIVVGMPRNMDGTYGEAAARVREFVAVLKDTVAVPLKTWDERLTSVLAERFLREGNVKGRDRKAKVDKTAAALLLQSYLDNLAPAS
jgi:putative holliday junction resolvase